jgi:hypothetical protein
MVIHCFPIRQRLLDLAIDFPEHLVALSVGTAATRHRQQSGTRQADGSMPAIAGLGAAK